MVKKKRRVFTVMALLGHRTKHLNDFQLFSFSLKPKFTALFQKYTLIYAFIDSV
jgi:hypothetical protein